MRVGRVPGASAAPASGADIHAKDLGHLRSFRAWTSADLERRARRHASPAAARNYSHMQKSIAGTVGQSTKPKPLSGLYHLTVAFTAGPVGLSNCGPLGGDTSAFPGQ
jgi:hypothetical protein